MESSSGFLQLTLISCKSLRAFNFFQKLSVYALVSIAIDGDRKLSQRTPTDREGDGDPEWNHTIRFELHDHLFRESDKYFLHFHLYHEGAMFGDKFIGEVVVPLVDLIQESNGAFRFVTYQVRTRDGKSNGELNFSFQVKIGMDQGLKMESPASMITGYPLLLPHPHHSPEPEPEAQFCSSEVGNGSPRVQYPRLDLQDMLVQGPQLHSSSYGKQDLNPIQESNYFLPQNGYYQLPTPPPPPPAAMGQGGPYFYCYPPPPPGSDTWGPAPYAAHGGSQLGSVDGALETWSNGWAGVRGNYHSSSGNSW
ncbi:hypothetical protein HRI_000262100 [Hibiscus trionum]|uniref:C2 domain-containing protein n=1 Tax=Hibiscus trionum TaxID=183268 RepID=A0A9W7LIC8_HIBTR|nr:hypothetical protein HRI_000262100 [Hibiscus trionum]